MTDEMKAAIATLRKFVEVDKFPLRVAYDKTMVQHTLGLNEVAELWNIAKEKYGKKDNDNEHGRKPGECSHTGKWCGDNDCTNCGYLPDELVKNCKSCSGKGMILDTTYDRTGEEAQCSKCYGSGISPESMVNTIKTQAKQINELVEALSGIMSEWDKFTKYGSPMAKQANKVVAFSRDTLAKHEEKQI